MNIGELGRRYSLPDDALIRLRCFGALLASDSTAPTSVRDPEGVLTVHLADSLVALELDVVRCAASVADLGSGAGLPGLPLAIALPEARVSLVESNRRKCEFLERAIGVCELVNARAVPERAESWAEGAGRFDLVTARAVAPLGVLTEYAAPLLRIGGALVAWRGKRDPEVEAEAARAAEILGLCVHEPVPVAPYPAAEHRHLHVAVKVRETPDRFPRRPGIARKRPLGAHGRPREDVV